MIKLVEVKLGADLFNQPCYNVVLREDDGTDGCILGVQNIDAAMDAALKLVDSHVAANAPNVTYRLRSALIKDGSVMLEWERVAELELELPDAAHGFEDPDPPCECVQVDVDIMDASGCPAHGTKAR